MDLKNKYSEFIFWLLQLVGWTMINAVIYIIPELSQEYKLFSFITATILSIIITSLYRLYLKRNIIVDSFNQSSLLKLVLAFFVCTIVYYAVLMGTDKLYEVIWKRTHEEIKWYTDNFSIITSILNSAFTILGWTVIYMAVKFIMNANKNRMESLELNATLREAQLNTLKGQVNPHFMFNSLNNIRGLMLEDVGKSREMITKLSEMLQYALSKNTVDAIALSEEIEMVDNYIALAKIQMEDRLQYDKDIDPDTLKVEIPPMIIQLLVENAAKHGISNLKSGGKISLKTALLNQELILTVRNTGKLSISKDSTKLGLKNIRQRLRLLYGPKAEFSLEEIEEEVVATIKIPMV
tara:strand:- start:30755 stop:31807 length:1053 start_codon:yes stop_codon:yes gene_type:complete